MNIFLIIDESGSMGPLQAETVSGVNKFVAEQVEFGKLETPGKRVKPARLHITKFDTMGIRKPVWDVPVEDVKPWTLDDYRPGAGTPLLDAVGDSLTEAKGKKALAVIITDGFENASRRWTKAQVKDLITRKQNEGWTVLFMGANIDAFGEAGAIGVSTRTTSGYQPDAAGTQAVYASASMAARMSRSGVSYSLTSDMAGNPTASADPGQGWVDPLTNASGSVASGGSTGFTIPATPTKKSKTTSASSKP